jgi:hypothetical protein
MRENIFNYDEIETRFFDICLFAGLNNFKSEEIKANIN